jgi:hypothetical protein
MVAAARNAERYTLPESYRIERVVFFKLGSPAARPLQEFHHGRRVEIVRSASVGCTGAHVWIQDGGSAPMPRVLPP